MSRHARILVAAVAFSLAAPTIAWSENEDKQSEALAASPNFPARLFPLVDDLDVQLQLTYGASRPVLDARVQYTLFAVAAWQRSGRTPRDEVLLEQWLRNAIVRSTPGRRELLPPVPEFSSRSERLAAEANSEDVAPETASMPPGATQVRDAPDRLSPPLPQVLTLPIDEIADTTEPDAAALVTPRQASSQPSTVPPSQEPADSFLVPALVAGSTGGRVAVDWPVAEPVQRLADGDIRPIPRVPTDIDFQTPAEVDRPADWAGHALQIDPRAVDASAGVDRPLPPASINLEFNLREYAARLAGHRRGIRLLEARLNDLRDPTADQLADLIGELERLTSQAALLEIYTRLLPPDLRATYGQPASARVLIDSLQELIAVGRAATRDDRQMDVWAGLADRTDRIADDRSDLHYSP